MHAAAVQRAGRAAARMACMQPHAVMLIGRDAERETITAVLLPSEMSRRGAS